MDKAGWLKYANAKAAPAPTPAPTPAPAPAKKTNEQIADEVIAGKWGNGADRKKRLTEAGYNYDAIQAIVDQKMGAKKPTVINYAVRKGDTLSAIAYRYGTTVATTKAEKLLA